MKTLHIADLGVGDFPPGPRLLGGVAAAAKEDGRHAEALCRRDIVADPIADHDAGCEVFSQPVAGAKEDARIGFPKPMIAAGLVIVEAIE